MTAIGPGSVVVCVDASNMPPDMFPLRKGARYIVRRLYHDATFFGPGVPHDEPGIALEGIDNRNPTGGENLYRLSRFRPIDDSDSQIFRDILADTDERVLA